MHSALLIHAGPRARQHLRDRGLQPQDVRVVAGAAGGPKGLILLPLDAYLFGHWLPQGGHEVDLIGASIGAWRMAAACMPDPVEALRRLGHDYIHERYGAQDGKMPPAAVVSDLFRRTLQHHFGGRESVLLEHPRWRLHILTSRGRGLLNRPGRLRMPLGFATAVALNAMDRRLLGLALERVWFTAKGNRPAWMVDELRTADAPLSPANFADALVASCSIPFWLQAVNDISLAPEGSYWDGGLTDYHVHLPFSRMSEGLALIPHFQPRLVPGWLDKPLRRRHGYSPFLDNAVVLSPHPDWARALPGGKIPDRSDFKRHLHNPQERERLWTLALRASEQLAAEFAEAVQQPHLQAHPLP